MLNGAMQSSAGLGEVPSRESTGTRASCANDLVTEVTARWHRRRMDCVVSRPQRGAAEWNVRQNTVAVLF